MDVSLRVIDADLEVRDLAAGHGLNPGEFGSQGGQENARWRAFSADMTVVGVFVQSLRARRCLK